jgi:hypothetical protein
MKLKFLTVNRKITVNILPGMREKFPSHESTFEEEGKSEFFDRKMTP